MTAERFGAVAAALLGDFAGGAHSPTASWSASTTRRLLKKQSAVPDLVHLGLQRGPRCTR